MRGVKELLPYARNSRTHSDEQVAQIMASIKEWGFTNPILVDGSSVIIAGHGRLLAAQRMGMEDVPTVLIEGWTDAQKQAYVIADNKLGLNAGWDDEMLRIELAELAAEGFDLELTGFDIDEINALDPESNEGLTEEDTTPPLPIYPATVSGDIWVMGKHRLMCGDATAVTDIESLMDGLLADQYITDPPYNVAYVGKTKEALTIENDQQSDDDFRLFLRDSFASAGTYMKPGAVFYIWHADSEGYNFRGAARDVDWQVRQCLIWKKQHMVMGRQDYHWMHEPCLYGWKPGSGHLWATDRKQTTILEFDRPSKNTEHPTMKPVALIEYLIGNNTKGGDLVLDTFGGSGTTLIACEKLGRVCRMTELDPKYCDVIVKRWQEFTGAEAILESTGTTFEEVSGERTQTETHAA